jgi:hypothetical protein
MDLVLRLARLDLLPPSLEHALDHDVWGPLIDSPTTGDDAAAAAAGAAANGDAAAAAAGGGGDEAAAAGGEAKGQPSTAAAAAAAAGAPRARKRSRRYVQTGKASSKSGGVGTGFLRSLIMLQVSLGVGQGCA